MKIFPRSQIIFLAIFLFLLLSLPIVLFLTTQRRHDIRPRAEFAGNADLLLYSSNATPSAGDIFDVIVKTQLTNKNLRISGADFKVFYSKDLLEAVNVAPAVGGDKQPFTDVLINKKNESYDGQFNYLWVSEIAKKDDDKLAGGFVQLAKVKFKAKNSGNAAIKFPDSNSELQIVGIDLGGSVTPVPTSSPTPTPKPYGCPVGSSCTPKQQCRPVGRIISGGKCPEDQICCAEVTPTSVPSVTVAPTPTGGPCCRRKAALQIFLDTVRRLPIKAYALLNRSFVNGYASKS